MPDCGRRGKPKGRFSSAPTVLGNRKQRDFHIPTAPTSQWKSGKPKTGLPTFPLADMFFLFYSKSKRRPEGGRSAPAFRLIFQ
jgi:hypothetical protein